jgi:hypothetical protein
MFHGLMNNPALIDEIIDGWPEDGFLEAETCSHSRVSKLNYLGCV